MINESDQAFLPAGNEVTVSGTFLAPGGDGSTTTDGGSVDFEIVGLIDSSKSVYQVLDSTGSAIAPGPDGYVIAPGDLLTYRFQESL